MVDEETTPAKPAAVRFNDPSHPPPIPQQRPTLPRKAHRHHRKERAPFLPEGHVAAKHGLRAK
jgi:hypothetical protein